MEAHPGNPLSQLYLHFTICTTLLSLPSLSLMRLLNTTTKKLESFYDEHVPLYAILSHTWGDEEVLFRHIEGSDDARSEGKKRKGYAKVVGACDQAIKDGWKYIWIDTCCIDKESSAELSEAINSMYRWYRRAQVCYVYLEDVYSNGHIGSSAAKDTDGDEGRSPVKTVPFRQSRWFTRGWTLQELLAPQFIVFYSKDWVDIGTRASLQGVISATTGIRVEMLLAYDPKKASIAERMSWAARRETSRKEDMAYCLMGLFSVNMPLLYGEGNKAFRRLQEEIMKVSDDLSLFAWKGRYSSYIIPDDMTLPSAKNHKAQGMLANSPWDFRDGVDIAPSDDGAFSPYSMTNQGLQIQLPLQPIDSERDLIDIDSDYRRNIFKATLKCTIRNKRATEWIVIYLKMVRKGYYERVFAHLLHATETNPNESELTSLVVPQVDTSPIYYHDIPTEQWVYMKTLPTESGFTTNGYSLVKGHEHLNKSISTAFEYIESTVFHSPKGECFAVTFGFKNGLFWLDVYRVDKNRGHPQERNKLRQAYREGGNLCNRVLWHLDRRTVGNSDHLIVVSAKKFNKGGFPSILITVDIQRTPSLSLARGLLPPSPPATSTSDSFYYHVQPDFKEECSDWITIFNPNAKRLSVNPVRTIHPRSTGTPPSSYVVRYVQFSPDGNYLAVASWSGTSGLVVRVYDTNMGEPYVLFGDTIDDTQPTCVCFSPNGKFLATGDINGRIVFWDIKKGWRVHKVFSDRQDRVRSLCFSPDGRLVGSGLVNGTIQIWDVADKTSPISTIDSPNSGNMNDVAISYNGRLVAANCNNTLWIWDIATTQLVLKQFPDTYSNIIFTPDGKGLVIGGLYGLCYLDVSNTGPDDGLSTSGMLFQGNTRPQIISKPTVRSIAISRDGQSIISGLNNGSVEFLNVNSNLMNTRFMLQGHIDTVDSVDMSPVGNVFATGGYDGRVRIWRYDHTT